MIFLPERLGSMFEMSMSESSLTDDLLEKLENQVLAVVNRDRTVTAH